MRLTRRRAAEVAPEPKPKPTYPPKQRGKHYVAKCANCRAALAAAGPGPAIGLEPGGRLERLLRHTNVNRPLRRAILSVVQAPDTKRRVRLERRVRRQLEALGLSA